MKKEPTKFRLLAVSRNLFLKQGYSETGLNQIVDEAKTVKASLYQHFSSKEELGKEVLKIYSDENLNLLKTLMKRNPKPLDFIRAWVRILSREARMSQLFGCGMANFRAQINSEEVHIRSEIERIANQTIECLSEFLQNSIQNGYISKKVDPYSLAKQLFIVYEGVLQSYRLLDDKKSLDELYKIAENLIPVSE
ncbi:TetR/AcrR family transcriptional regulator [Leptospira levettii]|uniref:TetR/AcrR family transcriptional regulator n=1 Tax=Leptospira levettii TaxID=2023178 RepID=A0A5F2D8C8_9LEPT|nr:TetR/AcrR family transcriptional regulator [Leptospira levettii]MCW7465557.1 TetR/AcrR family transcriptional regulator [Leptospira levettii]MCW7510296.1 TetR/AcrR family transcriptional regulator [Leptospira levettii]MCW7514048.1 TetR/AcrR family transcriptional regulator [Leptospira levettii]TGM29676.1 TetR/AcrR family transcriptional regulator [Leptospira levettii]TGM69124.1 TetR/AcrR family transcriptional regulator [Leptospira levettii]